MANQNDFKFAIIGPLRVDDMSANQPDIIAGYPMPTAVAGLGYKAVLDLNRDLGVKAFEFAGASVIVHSHSMQDGHPKNPVVGTDGSKGAPIVDELKARATLSFVFALDPVSDGPFGDSAVDDRDVAAAISKRLPGWFFGGGKVFLPDGKSASDTVVVSGKDDFTASLRRLPPGTVLLDRRDLLEAQSETAADPLDALLDLVETRPFEGDAVDGKNATPEYRRLKPGWLVPIFVGYQGIETPQPRIHARFNNGVTPHVYAESIYSIGEYKSLRSLLAIKGSEALDNSFWSHRVHRLAGTYYVSAINPLAA